MIEENMLGTMAVDNFASRSQNSGRVLENIQVYESKIERSLYKAQLEFQKLQFIRHQKEAQLRNEPNQRSSCVSLESNSNPDDSRDSSNNKTNPTCSTACGLAAAPGCDFCLSKKPNEPKE